MAAFICPDQHTEQNSLIILSKRTVYRQNYRREFILDEYLSPEMMQTGKESEFYEIDPTFGLNRHVLNYSFIVKRIVSRT